MEKRREIEVVFHFNTGKVTKVTVVGKSRETIEERFVEGKGNGPLVLRTVKGSFILVDPKDVIAVEFIEG